MNIKVKTKDFMNAVNMIVDIVKDKENKNDDLIKILFSEKHKKMQLGSSAKGVSVITEIPAEGDRNITFALKWPSLSQGLSSFLEDEYGDVLFISAVLDESDFKSGRVVFALNEQHEQQFGYCEKLFGIKDVHIAKFPSEKKDISSNAIITDKSLKQCVDLVDLSYCDFKRLSITKEAISFSGADFSVNAWILDIVLKHLKGKIEVQETNHNLIRFRDKNSCIIASNKTLAKIKLKTKDLANAVNMVSSVLKGDKKLIRFDMSTDEQKLHVTGSNNEINLITKIPAFAEKDISFALDGPRIKKVLCYIDEDEEDLEFHIHTRKVIMVLGEESSYYEWPMFGVSETPFMSFSGNVTLDTIISSEALNKCIYFCKHAIANTADENKISFTYSYHMELQDSELKMTSCDTRRISIYGRPDINSDNSLTVNAWVLNLVSKYMKGDIRIIETDKSYLKFEDDNTIIVASNSVMHYFNVERELLRHEIDMSFTINKNLLYRLTEKASAIFDGLPAIEKQIYITVSDNTLHVSAQSSLGCSFQKSVSCKSNGYGKYLLNPTYLLEVLNVIEDEEIKIDCSKRNIFIIKGDNYLEFICLKHF